MMKFMFAWGGFGFGLCLAGGLIDDKLITAVHVWALGLGLLVGSIIVGACALFRALRHLASIRGQSPD